MFESWKGSTFTCKWHVSEHALQHRGIVVVSSSVWSPSFFWFSSSKSKAKAKKINDGSSVATAPVTSLAARDVTSRCRQGRQYDILLAGEAKEDFRSSSSGTGQNHLVHSKGSSSAKHWWRWKPRKPHLKRHKSHQSHQHQLPEALLNQKSSGKSAENFAVWWR